MAGGAASTSTAAAEKKQRPDPTPTRSSTRKRKNVVLDPDEAEVELDQIDQEMERAAARKRSRRVKLESSKGKSSTAETEAKAKVTRTPKAKAKAEEEEEEKEKEKEKGKAKIEENGDDVCAEEPDSEELALEEELDEEEENQEAQQDEQPKKRVAKLNRPRKSAGEDEDKKYCFAGEPFPDAEAKERWPDRYRKGNGSVFRRPNDESDSDDMKAKKHYSKATVDGKDYHLADDVYVKAVDGELDYIGQIVEFFEGTDGESYFNCRWYFRPVDTVISFMVEHHKHEPKRVFLSDETNVNILDCIVSKIKIVRVRPNTDLATKESKIPECDLYYDMSYSVAYSTFKKLPPENDAAGSGTPSSSTSEEIPETSSGKTIPACEDAFASGTKKAVSLLDLYSGCGGMSTGLCLGAAFAEMDLQTSWAVDLNVHACESLKLNHPRTQVRNVKAEDYFALIKEFKNLVDRFVKETSEDSDDRDEDDADDDGSDAEDEVFEVGEILDICYGDPKDTGKVGLKFKVRWKGYGPEEDTWEPLDGLGNCDERIKDFVVKAYERNLLPLPGRVDIICGGPPCQGISGFNRFRDQENPLRDEKNKQMAVYMDIVEFLKPKYVLIENVVDILKFAKGYLGRYALSRLVLMNYQARLGMMVAGCYGLPQFRMRFFLWGALPNMGLPQFPLPTHDVVVRGGVPNEFTQNIVAFDETQTRTLNKELVLSDALNDLPEVGTYEERDAMPYGGPPRSQFQRFIRLPRSAMLDFSHADEGVPEEGLLYDHQPLRLNQDDYDRVCEIPKRKGANFRDLPGVIVGPNNVVEWDPKVKRVLLKSGKPLVPDYAMSFIKGKSPKPFGRLWWDETVPTVVTRAEPHNQVILHPEQDRVLTIRENARLQGFPDYYRLIGPIKERYIQVGNAVAVPVARALGYALGRAFNGLTDGDGPLFKLPTNFTAFSQPSAETDGLADTRATERGDVMN